jgi:chaperonin GroES
MELNLKKDYLLVRPEEAKTETESGLILTKPQAERTWRGEVLNVGTEVKDIQVGDTVLFPTERNGSTPFRYDGDNLLLIRDEVIMATL